MKGPLNSIALAMFLASLWIVTAVWSWLGLPIMLARPPLDPALKLDCVSYAPFRGQQSPWVPGLVVSPEQIEADLVEVARISKCVRTYSVDNGLDKVPELASKIGLKVMLGVWIGSDQAKNRSLIEAAQSLVKEYPQVITAMIVGSEVLLRNEMTPSELRETLRSAKMGVAIPVSYADVWEFWLYYPDVANDVDFLTIHLLPYWENHPVRIENAAEHVNQIRARMANAFPGKEVLIGEVGWPSHGRMRDGALPSPINQARFISDILARAKHENFRVTLFEAYDERWKHRWEGTVGAYWGLLDRDNGRPKYLSGEVISNHPLWKLQLWCGLIMNCAVFGAGWLATRARSSPPRLASWTGVAISAIVSATMLGIAVEKLIYEGFGFEGWLVQGSLLATGVVAPVLTAYALMSGRPLPTFAESIGQWKVESDVCLTFMLGIVLMVTTLMAVDVAANLVFYPSRTDFPFAALSMAVVPYGTLKLLNRKRLAQRQMVEAIFACLFAGAGLYIPFNEGIQNWQAVWTSALFCALASTLWRQPSVITAEVYSNLLPPPTAVALPHDIASSRGSSKGVAGEVERSL